MILLLSPFVKYKIVILSLFHVPKNASKTWQKSWLFKRSIQSKSQLRPKLHSNLGAFWTSCFIHLRAYLVIIYKQNTNARRERCWIIIKSLADIHSCLTKSDNYKMFYMVHREGSRGHMLLGNIPKSIYVPRNGNHLFLH